MANIWDCTGGFCKGRLISQLRNFPTAWCSCLQTAITSSFQLQFVHHLKRWTPNFPSFKTTYSMHKMNSRKYSKCIQQLLSSWILHVRFLCFSSLEFLIGFGKELWSSKAWFFMNLSFQKLFHELYTALPHYWIALV